MACRWADRDHVVVEGGLLVTPHALSVASDRRRLLSVAAAWTGDVAPDRLAAVFQTGAHTYSIDRMGRPRTRDTRRAFLRTRRGAILALDEPDPDGCTVLRRWTDGGRHMLRTKDGVLAVADRRGEIVRTAGVRCEGGSVALLNARTLLLVGDGKPGAITSGLTLFNVDSGRRTEVRVFGMRRATATVVVARATGERSGPSPFTTGGRLPRHTDARRGVSFALPWGWSTDGCRDEEPDDGMGDAAVLCATVPAPGGHVPAWVMAYATSTESPADLLARIRSGHEGPPSCRESITCVRELRRGRTRLLGQRWRILDLGFWEGRSVFLARRFGERTVVVQLPAPYDQSDHTMASIIASIEA
jgi:hypothetical protein